MNRSKRIPEIGPGHIRTAAYLDVLFHRPSQNLLLGLAISGFAALRPRQLGQLAPNVAVKLFSVLNPCLRSLFSKVTTVLAYSQRNAEEENRLRDRARYRIDISGR